MKEHKCYGLKSIWIFCFVLVKHAEMDFYSASSLKQQSAGRHVAPPQHIILTPNQPVFVHTP